MLIVVGERGDIINTDQITLIRKYEYDEGWTVFLTDKRFVDVLPRDYDYLKSLTTARQKMNQRKQENYDHE